MFDPAANRTETNISFPFPPRGSFYSQILHIMLDSVPLPFYFLLPREHVLFCSGLSRGLAGLQDSNLGRREVSTKIAVVWWSSGQRPCYYRPPVTGSYLGPGLPTVWSAARQITL